MKRDEASHRRDGNWRVVARGVNTLMTESFQPAYVKTGVVLFRVVAGTGTIRAADRTIRLAPGGGCYHLLLDVPRIWTPDSSRGLTVEYVRIASPSLDWTQAASLGFAATRRLCPLADEGRFEEMLHDWSLDADEPNERQQRVLRSVISSMFAENAVDSRIRKSLSAIIADPANDWRLPDLAKAAGVGCSTLRRWFVHELQEPPNRFVRRLRAREACRLLSMTDDTVVRIARAMHFKCEFAFSRFFKSVVGLSPTGYRIAIRNS